MSDTAKSTAWDWVDRNRSRLSEWHGRIWELAEPAWREYRSAAWYVDLLRSEGFEVEEGSGGMPTAFSATWRNGPGPTLLTYAEYDAVPGNCQAGAPRPEPRSGVSPHAPGHTDPHSALGISTLGAVLAAKEAMQRNGIGGTIRYTGEPAEKVQGSKVVHGLRGYYDDVDAIISFHPFYMLPLCNTVRWDTHCGAYYSRIYSFRCDEPETWGVADPGSPIPASHSAARAPGANAALMTMYSLTKSTQDSMAPAFGGWSLSEAILSAGNATADNLPAGIAQIQYSWRCPDIATAEQVLRVLDANAEAAARTAHCGLETRWVSRNRPGLANHAMAEVTYRNLAQVGPPEYGPEAVEVAREVQRSLGVEPTEDPLLAECSRLVEPTEAERLLRENIPPSQRNWTSDDYVEMTHYAPTARLYIARPALAPIDGRPTPSWAMNALGGIPATIDPTIICAAKTIAGTLLDLARSPEVLAAAKAEFEERRAESPEPLLPKDFEAPHDYPWPEYVTTARGSGWQGT
ncbi:zinc-binding metallopeptidase family protein [Saccharopolyspora elongata]|uniref:Amidohydrolase n=1 Tax=Saccharopolyspora elongata TaxID=2530387 RepID=A0A4R4ZEC6_9PSEU|nr:amidohydrolase [Saccharopolyspora elongata]TDD55659.1 amidohydrolase [Saccharopolyspora elongata]